MYLGLAPEDAYETLSDEHMNSEGMLVEAGEMEGEANQSMSSMYAGEGVMNVSTYPTVALSTSSPTSQIPVSGGSYDGSASERRQLHSEGVRTVSPRSTGPFVVTPNVFDDAQHIGDRFQRHQPIILNLQSLDRDIAKRLLDFTSGLCYGLKGEMTKVANQVYLLVPPDVELSDEDRHQIGQSRYRA